MNVIISTNGGLCIQKDISLECPNCEGTKFKIEEGEHFVGHNHREYFMVITCDGCKKTLDVSIDVG